MPAKVFLVIVEMHSSTVLVGQGFRLYPADTSEDALVAARADGFWQTEPEPGPMFHTRWIARAVDLSHQFDPATGELLAH